MSEISVTLKGGPEYAAPWIVVKAESVDQLGEIMAQIRSKGVLAAVQAAGIEFEANKVEGAAAAMAQGTVVSQEQQLPKDMLPKCPDCGADTYAKSGHSTAKNRDYSGVFCAVNEKHKPAQFTWTS